MEQKQLLVRLVSCIEHIAPMDGTLIAPSNHSQVKIEFVDIFSYEQISKLIFQPN